MLYFRAFVEFSTSIPHLSFAFSPINKLLHLTMPTELEEVRDFSP